MKEMIQIQSTRADVDACPMHEPNLIYTWQKNKIICSCLWKIVNKMAIKMPLNMKNINNFTQWKNGSVDVTIMCAKAPRAVWAQYAECSGHFQRTTNIY